MTVTSGAALDLFFNATGNTVNFFDPFWTQAQSWTVLSSSSSALSGTFALGSVSVDAAGQATASYGAFSLSQTGAGMTLNWTPSGYSTFRGTYFGANAGNPATSGALAQP